MTRNSQPVKVISKSKQILRTTLSFLFPLVLLWSCINPPNYLGGDLLPEDDFVRVKTDTSFIISAYTERLDTIHTNSFTDAVMGETWDPIFGKTRASFLTQLRLEYLNSDYGTDPVVDSAFLYLKLLGQLGKEPMQFAIYELIDSLATDSLYNALAPASNMFNIEEPIGQTTEDYVGEETILKIPVSTEWVLNRLVNPILADSTIVSSQDSFLNHMYGIYVAPITTLSSFGKGMYYFDYTSSDSKLTVFYRDLEENDTIKLSNRYSFVNANIRYNLFDHNTELADPNLKVQFNYPNETLVQDSVFYIKGLGLARGILMFDDVIAWADSMPVAIHRAELLLELEEHPNMPKDTLIDQLFMYKLVDGKRVGLADYITNSSTFGGNYRKPTKNYSFNITQHLQGLLKNPDSDLIIYIEQVESYLRANSAVLRSGSHSSRIKLIVTYTKL